MITDLFESLFVPHDRLVFCKECYKPYVRKVKLRFTQISLTSHSCEPVWNSGIWTALCPNGHDIKNRIDGNIRYILNNPKDFIQYGDPRFAKIYPIQHARIKAEEEEKKRNAEEIAEATEIADKQLIKQFGGAAQEALELLKEKHPDSYKVRPDAQFKQQRTGIKPGFTGKKVV